MPETPEQPNNERFEVSRRQFLIGGAGVTLALIGATAILSGCSSGSQQSDSIQPTELEVSSSQVVESSDFAELDTWSCIAQTAQYDLPMGAVGNMDCDDLAVFIYPGDQYDILSQIGFLSMTSGSFNSILKQAVSKSEGYQIYDARANDQIIVWVECNLYTDDWRLYLASVRSAAEIGQPVLMDEGDSDFDPPMLCVSGDKAFWTYMPSPDGSASESDSLLKAASVGDYSPAVVYTSPGRMITNPQQSDGIVTIVPRANTRSTRYQLTAIQASDGSVISEQMLPSSMQASDAIYMNGDFVFGIERTYSFGDGISNFGTYSSLGDGSGNYVRFNRTPLDTPAQCGKYLMVKSTKSVVGLDLSSQSYFAIDTVADSESYGDFLLSTGTSQRIVTYTTVPAGDGSGDGVVRVRVFSLL